MSDFCGKDAVSNARVWVVEATPADAKHGVFRVGEPLFTSCPRPGDKVIDALRISTDGDALTITSDRAVDAYTTDDSPLKIEIIASGNWGDQYEEGAEYELRDRILSRLFDEIAWSGRDRELGALRYKVSAGTEGEDDAFVKPSGKLWLSEIESQVTRGPVV